MTDTHSKEHDAHGPNLKLYVGVFVALCACTALSFLANWTMGQGGGSMAIIMVVAVIKACLVAMIFMHLKFDWGRVYFVIIPVTIMAIMMMIVLLPDIVLAWH